MDTDIIVAIIGSSALGALVGAIFNNWKNKYDKRVEYITQERSNWRKEIKNISVEIERCNYSRAKHKNLEVILQQLNTHLNAYGYLDGHEYEKDGHIWSAIDALLKSESKQEFLKHKKILLLELDLLLKADWERSKEEIKGKRFNAWNILIMLCIAGVYAFFYFGVCGEDEVLIFVFGALALAIYSFWAPSLMIIECFRKIRQKRKDIAVDKLVRIQKGEFWIKVIQVPITVLVIVGMYCITVLFGTLGVIENYAYDAEADRITITADTKLVRSINTEFEKERENSDDLGDLYLKISCLEIAKKFSPFAYIFFVTTGVYIVIQVVNQRWTVEYRDYVRRLLLKENNLYIDEISKMIKKVELLANDESKILTENEFVLRLLYIRLYELAEYLNEDEFCRGRMIETVADMENDFAAKKVCKELGSILKVYGKAVKKLNKGGKKCRKQIQELAMELGKLDLGRLV